MTSTVARARLLFASLAPTWTVARACLLLAWLAGLGCGTGEARSGPPNLVLVIGDDHGYPDFGFMGSSVVRTPNLDALAEGGVVFTHGYATASVCRPSLFTLLTGLEPLQWKLREGDVHARQGGRPPIESIATLPRLLRERGYATFQSGKHWEGHYALAGFEEGAVEGPLMREGLAQAARSVRHGLEPELAFIDRNADRPFFLWLAPGLPHLPHNPPEAYRRLYPDVPEPRQGYYASISWFDDGVGELVEHVRDLGLERSTLFLYVADNGWDPRPPESRENALLGGPRGKLSLYELGLRTPVLLYWRGEIEPSRRDELVSFTDVFVTLLDYAGVAAPADRVGHSLRPLLEGRGDWPRREIAGWMESLRGEPKPWGFHSGGFFWRDARWHYLKPARGEPALYDLDADPDETTDVKRSHPELVERAQRGIEAWSRTLRGGEAEAPPG